jgi:hypothetical protein
MKDVRSRPIKSLRRFEAYLKKLRVSDRILLSLFNSDSLTEDQFQFGHLIMITLLPTNPNGYISYGRELFRAYITHPLFSKEKLKELIKRPLHRRNAVDLLKLGKHLLDESESNSIISSIKTGPGRSVDLLLKARISYKRPSEIVKDFDEKFNQCVNVLDTDLAVALTSGNSQLRELSLLLKGQK